MSLKLGPLHELILYVQDMHAQVTFYRDTLGLPISYPADLDDYADQFWVVFETGQCSLALHGGGEQRLGEDAPKFVFKVDDIEQTRQELLAKNVNVSEVHSPSPGVHVADCQDPEGNLFSIESVN